MTDAQFFGWGILMLLAYSGWVIFWLAMSEINNTLWPLMFIPIPIIFLAL